MWRNAVYSWDAEEKSVDQKVPGDRIIWGKMEVKRFWGEVRGTTEREGLNSKWKGMEEDGRGEEGWLI